MNKKIVVYTSNYGSTKRYAQWIAEELSCPLFEKKAIHPQDFSDSQTVIYGGGLYAGSVNGINFITRNWRSLSDKNVVLFTCGLADPEDPANLSNIQSTLAKSLSAEMLAQIKIFHLRGGIDYPRLNFVHRSMMAMLRRMLLKKDARDLSSEDRQLLDTYGKCIDLTDRESIRPLAVYVRSSTDDV